MRALAVRQSGRRANFAEIRVWREHNTSLFRTQTLISLPHFQWVPGKKKSTKTHTSARRPCGVVGWGVRVLASNSGETVSREACSRRRSWAGISQRTRVNIIILLKPWDWENIISHSKTRELPKAQGRRKVGRWWGQVGLHRGEVTTPQCS